MPYQQYPKLRVLVLDDFEGFRSTVSRMFESFGVSRVDTASNAEDAMGLCKNSYYDAILSDYNLGKGQSGLQLLESLRHHQLIEQSQVYVLVSAENSKQIVLAASDVEPDAYLSKPITFKMLQHRLDRILVQRDELKPLFRALDQSNVEAAISVCREHISSRGHQSSFCQKYLGQLLLDKNELDEAESVYRSVLEVRPLEWAKIGMAQVKSRRGEAHTAERWFRELINGNPLCLKAYDGLAEVYESLDDEVNLQKVLEEAVNVSPLALLRQQKLAKAAANNGDFDTASRAYRRVIRLADHSVYKSADQNLDYARAVVCLAEQKSNLAADFTRDSIQKLSSTSSKENQLDVRLQSLMLQTQLFMQQKDEQKAIKRYSEASKIIDQEVETPLLFNVEVERVKTLRCLGRKLESDKLLLELCDNYKNDEPKLEVLDNLLDEPRSAKNRKLIARINKEGIKNYQAKQYEQAIESFQYAQKMFPNHIGVQLNLAQALLDEMTEFGCKKNVMEEVERLLRSVEADINPTHQQYRRLVKLKEIRQALAFKANG